MSIARLIAILGACVGLTAVVARGQAGFTFKHEPRAIGSADIFGYAIWTAQLGTISLNGYSIPLRLDFTTDPRPSPVPSLLGRGWSMPFFSSALVEEDQSTLRWHRPDGRIFYFSRQRGSQDGKPAKAGDPINFVSTESSWKAVKEPRKRYIIISHISNGCELIYEEGRLVRFRLTKQNENSDTYIVYYNRFGRPLKLSNLANGNAIVEFGYGSADRANKIIINGKELELKFSEYDVAQFPSGPYLDEVSGDSLTRFRILYSTDKDKNVNRVRFENASNVGETTGLAWHASSGFIAEDDGANYKIENPSLENGGRAKQQSKSSNSTDKSLAYNWRPNEAKVTRIDQDGKSEYRYFDLSRGTSTTRDKNGVTKIVYFLQAQGPLMNKVRKIEEIRDGKTTLLERNAYDELGRMVRQIDAAGAVTIWEWSEDGNFVRVIKDGQLIEETVYKNHRLVAWKTYGPEGIKIRKIQKNIDEFGGDLKTLVPNNFLD